MTKFYLKSINKAIRYDKKMRDKREANHEVHEKFSLLSSREAQILQGIVDGKANKIISSELKISLKTVEAHRASLLSPWINFKIFSLAYFWRQALPRVSPRELLGTLE